CSPTSTPWRRVLATFWKNPAPPVWATMNMMSSFRSVRKKARLHRSSSPSGSFPRRPNFVRARDDRVERRIGDEGVGEPAGRVGSGARELGRCGGTKPLAEVEERRQGGERLVRDSHRRAHVVERMIAVEIGIHARAVADLDAHVLEAPGDRDAELRNDLEGVGQVDADVLLSGGDVHVGPEIAGPDGADAVAPGREGRRCFALGEARRMPVVGDPDGESVLAAYDPAAVLELKRRAPVVGLRAGLAVLALRVP